MVALVLHLLFQEQLQPMAVAVEAVTLTMVELLARAVLEAVLMVMAHQPLVELQTQVVVRVAQETAIQAALAVAVS
jgi:hypothetical protein